MEQRLGSGLQLQGRDRWEQRLELHELVTMANGRRWHRCRRGAVDAAEHRSHA
jgi:hypothetical protein